MSSKSKETGPNQHYIPQMLLRGFGVFRKKRGNRSIYDVLVCTKEKQYICATNRVCSENCFYSAKGDPAQLDTLISDYEAEVLSKSLAALKACAINEDVDSNIASEVIAHLALRTAHLRKGLAEGTKRLVAKLATKADISTLFSQKVGIDKGVPSDFFIECVTGFLGNNPYPFTYSIPREIIIKALFFHWRENKQALLNNTIPLIQQFFFMFFTNIDKQIETGHKKALLPSQAPQPHIDYLRRFRWKIQNAPKGGAILPDCVAIAVENDGKSSPYVFRKQKSDRFIIIALDSNRLLVGSNSLECFCLDYNTLAAQTCNSFFICRPGFPHAAQLQSLISISAKKTLFESVDDAIKNVLRGDESGFSFRIERKYADKLTVNFLHGFDNSAAEKVARTIANIITKVSNFVSTDAIAGVFFTNTNFSDASCSITDHEFPVEHILKKEERLKENNITFQVIRLEDGKLQYFIVCSYEVANALYRENNLKCSIAYNFVRYIACLSIINNDHSPLNEKSTGSIHIPFEDFLYTVFEAYLGTRIAGSIVQIEKDNFFQNVVDKYGELSCKLCQERVELETHKNCTIFLENTISIVTSFLRNLAAFYGHWHAGNHGKIEQAGMISDRLKENSLDRWLLCYEEDLIRLFDCLTHAGSVGSLEVLSLHFERIYASASFFLAKQDGGYLCYPLPLDAFTLKNA